MPKKEGLKQEEGRRLTGAVVIPLYPKRESRLPSRVRVS